MRFWFKAYKHFSSSLSDTINVWVFGGLLAGSSIGYYVLGLVAGDIEDLLFTNPNVTVTEIAFSYQFMPVIFTVGFGFIGAFVGYGVQKLINLRR